VTRTGALVLLVARFLVDVVASGWVTTRVILSGPGRLQPGFVRVRYGDLDETGAALLAALVTLTPGTTAVDLDPDRREILLHLLDVRHSAATVASLRRDFERPLLALLGRSR
jgi:multisubunit Na+/H+ antiporter MnhE subunit